ncbi:MAG: elongation factor G [Cyclobacteriaceae bacterium]|jgi:elongation factor G
MKVFDQKHIKNIVLIGAPKSGKTTLTETMLFEARLIDRRGTVEEKNTVSDYHEIEHDRGNSIYATSVHTEWKSFKINIIDTPGLDDFEGEVASSIRVADTAVLVLNAQYGLEVSTENLWDTIDHHKKPTLIAINQVDHPKSDFFNTYEMAKSKLGDAVSLIQYPLLQGESFHEVVDLLKMILYRFPETGGKPEKLPIPKEEVERANSLHNALVEKAAVHDEGLMEKYFKDGTLNENDLKLGLKMGMMEHDVFPVFCLSAKKNIGSGRMMGFIDNVAPAFVDTMGELTSEGKVIIPQPEGPTGLFVFKTLVEPFLGKVSFFKVCTGQVHIGDELINSQTGEKERINQLYIMDGKYRQSVDHLFTGDIGATVKLKSAQTNCTLHSIETKISFNPIKFPSPKLRVSITTESKDAEELMAEHLRHMQEEDPTLNLKYHKELRQLILSGQGELHLAMAKWRLEQLNNIQVTFGTPKVPYRETIQKPATVSYRHKKQSGGSGQFAEVTLTVMPYQQDMIVPEGFNIRSTENIDLEWGGKLIFHNCIVGGAIDARFVPAVIKGIKEVMENGPITQSYVRDVVVLLHDGKMHAVDSNDISFKIAGSYAFKEAFMKAQPLVLEPQHDLSVTVGEDMVGEVMTDLQSRRAMVTGIETSDQLQTIKAKIPLSALDHYVTALKSITQGRGHFSTNFSDYVPLPNDLQAELIN